MENTQGEDGLHELAETLKKKGLPSVEQMRADVEQVDRARFMRGIAEKIREYDGLFRRWYEKNDLSQTELQRMAGLSDELERLLPRQAE
jgi:hypothetical protein